MNSIVREPLVHFFALAVVLFVVHHWLVGDPRTIEVTAGTRAAVLRRFSDQMGHAPTSAEQDSALKDWKRDEALYREALRDRLDRDDPDIRALLINKVRGRAALEAPHRQPTPADLEQWLAAHRAMYETPRRYVLDWVPFPKQASDASEQRDRFEHAAQGGADLRFLGRPIYGATLAAEELHEKLGSALSEAIAAYPLAAWQRSENDSDLLLVRVSQVTGGLPSPEELRPRMVVDWTMDQQNKDVERSVSRIVDRYHFAERGR